MEPKDKFIAFVDILGFAALAKAEEEKGHDLSRLIELTKALASIDDNRAPRVCPTSTCLAKDLEFKTTQISDCVVVSAEASPAGVINLTHRCFTISLALLSKGALCRGYITRGNIYHDDRQFIGTGYIRAVEGEKVVAFMRADVDERGTPFIQIDDPVTDYVTNESDDCVRKMFGRITRSDGTYTAIYPFEALAKIPSALVQPGFDPGKSKESVQRSIGFRHNDLATFEKAERDATDEYVKRKIRHYKCGLDEVIERLRAKEAALDNMIATGKIPYGTVW